jgi:hypothetical protein
MTQTDTASNQELEARHMPASEPGCLEFVGNRTAALFTREVKESIEGVLRHNLYGFDKGGDAGFVSASVPGRACAGQFWSRDGGTFARELLHWGYFREAAMVMDCALSLVEKNAEGFFAFPMYWLPGQPASGHELDGTAAIAISLAHLCRRLDAADPRRERYYRFLHHASSPLAMLHHAIAGRRLIAGHGEFGGGMGVDGLHCNAVQNGLCRLALMLAAEIEDEFGDGGAAGRHRVLAQQISENMAELLTAPDGGWLWCVNADTLQPNQAVLDAYWTRGFGGIEGVCCMQADVCGFDPLANGWMGLPACIRTHERLANESYRRDLFSRLGMWPQFASPPYDRLTSPSYGQGYAIQSMLLLDRMDEAQRAIDYLAEATFAPPAGYRLRRESPYWFYERYLAPDFPDIDKFDEGCGALNTVNVSEPLKIARLIAGIDDTRSVPIIIPRLPPSWQGFRARRWPLWTKAGVISVDIDYQRNQTAERIDIVVCYGRSIPELTIFLGGPLRRHAYTMMDVSQLHLVHDKHANQGAEHASAT